MIMIAKIIALLALVYFIKYIIDRLNDKKENIGLDNTMIILAIALIVFIIFV